MVRVRYRLPLNHMVREVGRSMSDSERPKVLKFDAEPRMNCVIAYLNDQLAATVRYEDEKGIRRGDSLELATERGDVFGEAKVVVSIPCEVYEAILKIRDIGARYSVTNAENLISTLNSYYDEPIGLKTDVKVIIYEPDLFVDSQDGIDDIATMKELTLEPCPRCNGKEAWVEEDLCAACYSEVVIDD